MREPDVILRNGAAVRLHPIRLEDAPRLLALCDRLSTRTVYQRFFYIADEHQSLVARASSTCMTLRGQQGHGR
jgi:hypothetical protein